jgi:hypothetical protein
MKYIKAMWIASDPGGHVSLTGFEEVLDKMVRKPGGGRVHRKGTIGKGIVVTPCKDDGNEKQIHEQTGQRLFSGEFMVQDTPKNMKTFGDYVKLGFIQMDDYNLHYDLLGEEPIEPEVIEEQIVEEQIVEVDVSPKYSMAAQRARKNEAIEKLHANQEKHKKEVNAAIKGFTSLSSVKLRREEIFAGLADKGIMSIKQLSEANKDVLLSIQYVGSKVADLMIEEAKKLTGGLEEE